MNADRLKEITAAAEKAAKENPADAVVAIKATELVELCKGQKPTA